MFGFNLIRFCPAFLRPFYLFLRPFYLRLASGLRSELLWFKLRRIRNQPKSQKNAQGPVVQGPVIIAGLFSSTTGLGRGALLMLRDFQRKNIAVIGVDLTKYFNLPEGQLPEGVVRVDDVKDLVGSCLIIHLNPPEFLNALIQIPEHLREHSRIIGYWVWELELAPKSWARAAVLVDEIWVPSPLVAHAISGVLAGKNSVAIKVVPHATEVLPIGPRQSPILKAKLRGVHSLDARSFIAGYSFSARSSLARKNPAAALKAFQLAFPPEIDQVRFLMRAYDVALWPPGLEALRAFAQSDERIILFDGFTRDISIFDFFQIIDVYVSLHRSEGYGLTMMEAADVGIPVLATDWWLPPDIAARPEVIGVASRCVPVRDPQGIYFANSSVWAEADINDAASKLRALYDRK